MEDVLDISEMNHVKKHPIASRDLRFINHIIDGFITLGISVFIAIVLFYLFSSDSNLFFNSEEGSFRIFSYVIVGLTTIIYYITSESFLYGKTIGKFVTGTRAVTLDNQKMDLGTTINTSFYRLVPFNAWSFIGGRPMGWHDDWSSTKVILDKNWDG